MPTRHEPAAGFWIVLGLIALPLLYVAGFGPACWISSRLNAGTGVVTVVYRPITGCLRDDYDGPLDGAIRWYAGLGAAHGNWGWWGKDPCGFQEEPWIWRPLSVSP